MFGQSFGLTKRCNLYYYIINKLKRGWRLVGILNWTLTDLTHKFRSKTRSIWLEFGLLLDVFLEQGHGSFDLLLA